MGNDLWGTRETWIGRRGRQSAAIGVGGLITGGKGLHVAYYHHL